MKTLWLLIRVAYCRFRFNHARRPNGIFCRCCYKSYDEQAVNALAYITKAKERFS